MGKAGTQNFENVEGGRLHLDWMLSGYQTGRDRGTQSVCG